ncbi:MAG: hypothetical protein RL757_295 [Bacteroidota bacterium]|jgi:hypothetical protein
MKNKIAFLFVLLALGTSAFAQTPISSEDEDALYIKQIHDFSLTKSAAYAWLEGLCTRVGNRASGSANDIKAVRYAEQTLKSMGFDTVYLQSCQVPHWVRGEKEVVEVRANGKKIALNSLALGGSGASPKKGVQAEVIQVFSLGEVDSLGEKVRGKIIFFNRPMDRTQNSVFAAYGGGVDQRGAGPNRASKLGAVAVIVRSMTTEIDDFPHTGGTKFDADSLRIPALCISTRDAENLAKIIANNQSKQQKTEIFVKTTCQTLPKMESFNVVAELKGSTFPDEIIMVGGHLDSWDVGQGAHDDGAGCAHSISVLHTLKNLNYRPKRTLRVVLFANEEFGLAGGLKYAEIAKQKGEKHIAAIESDGGGHVPRGFTFDAEKEILNEKLKKIAKWENLLSPYGLTIGKGGSGADIGPLKPQQFLLGGLRPDSQRYFDFHHTQRDRFEGIHRRELELGAAAMTSLIYLFDKYGL